MNITYLLGAGASFQSVPIISQFKHRMALYAQYIRIMHEDGQIKGPALDNYLIDLDRLVNCQNDTLSIDSIAQDVARGTSPNKLTHIKRQIKDFLIFEQNPLKKREYLSVAYQKLIATSRSEISLLDVNKTIDDRYTRFLAEWDVGINGFPQNLSVLSWNYDVQIELALAQTLGITLDYAFEVLNSFPLTSKQYKPDRGCLLKLNGTAGAYGGRNAPLRFYSNLLDTNVQEVVKTFVQEYWNNQQVNYNHPAIDFAWQADPPEYAAAVLDKAKEIIAKTNVLVVVGYSFPAVNQFVDAELFSDAKFDAIYYQIPESNFQQLRDFNVKRVNENLIPLISAYTDLSAFCIPPERI